MGINSNQLRTLVIRPALSAMGMWSDAAEELLMLTAATESQLGTYIRQTTMFGDRGAFGIYQQEKPSYDQLWNNLVEGNISMRAKIRLYCGYDGKPVVQRMITDLSLATVMARLYYLNINEALPRCTDTEGLATYYKKYWNTVAGKNTIEKAIRDYQDYCR